MRILSAGNIEIYLLKRETGTNPSPDPSTARSFERHWTPVHLDFGVEDVNESAALVIEHGGQVEGGESGDWGAIAFCVDPFGHGFCLIKE